MHDTNRSNAVTAKKAPVFRLHYAASPTAAVATFPWGYVNAFPGNGSLRVMAHDSSSSGTSIFQTDGATHLYSGCACKQKKK